VAPTASAQQPVAKKPTVATVPNSLNKTTSPTVKKTAIKKPINKDIYTPGTGTSSSTPLPPKEMEKFRIMIQDLRVEQDEELELLTEQLREMTSSESNDENNAYSLHMAEQGTDAMEREKTFLQAQRVSDYIKKLDESLRRIQDATF